MSQPIPPDDQQGGPPTSDAHKNSSTSPSAGVYASVYAAIFSSSSSDAPNDDDGGENRRIPPPPSRRPQHEHESSAEEAEAEEESTEAIEASLSRCGSEIQISHKTLSSVTDSTRASSVTAVGSAEGDDNEEEELGRKKRRIKRPLFGALCYYTQCCGGRKRRRRKASAIVVGGLVVLALLLLCLVVTVGVVAGRGRGHHQSAASTTSSGDASDGLEDTGGGSARPVDPSVVLEHAGGEHQEDDGGDAHDTFANPTASPTQVPVTYLPGDLTVFKEGVYLSTGLDVRIIARSRQFVNLTDGTQSSERFHNRPDAGATFPIPEDFPELYSKYPGGWVYVSNAESTYDGGVGSIFFDANYNVVDYRKVLRGTEWNCGGGKTPWGTWVSNEEPMGYNRTGFIYEVDPFGRHGPEPRRTVLGEDGGAFESFAYDARDRSNPHFFYTEDHRRGPIRRFTPTNPDWDNPTEMLHRKGTIEYLVLENWDWTGRNGTFYWIDDRDLGEQNALLNFPYTEGIDCTPDGRLFFANKGRALLFELDLDANTWSRSSVQGGAFDGKPDTMARILDDPDDIVYLTEDGGDDAGVHGRDKSNNYYVILESPLYAEETTGLAFSPDGRRMYVAYQKNGILLEVWREDGLAFSGRVVDIKYHSLNSDRGSGII